MFIDTGTHTYTHILLLLLLLLSHFSRVRLCATPETAAHQAPLSLGFSRQEHWSGLPFSSPMHESEKWKWSRSVVSNPQRPHGLQPSRLLHPWYFPGKSTGMGCHCLLQHICPVLISPVLFLFLWKTLINTGRTLGYQIPPNWQMSTTLKLLIILNIFLSISIPHLIEELWID